MSNDEELTQELIKLTQNKQQLDHLLGILDSRSMNESFALKIIDKLLDRIEK